MATAALPDEINDILEVSPPRAVADGKFEIVLDVVTENESIEAFATRFKLDSVVIDPSGPGGGWPVVQFTGEAENLARMLAEYNGLDSIGAAELIETERRIREL